MLVSGASQLPFMISNADGGSRAFDEWYRAYSDKDMPGVKMCYMYTHDVASLHSKKEIRTPDQIKGMKIRPAHATMAQWMTSLGATTVQVSAPESREALERGVADAITFPWGSLFGFKIDGITKFHIDAPMYVATFATIINTDKYNALTAPQKKVIDDHCTTEWAARTGRDWAKWEDEGRQKIKAAGSGHTVATLTPQELDAWKKSAEPVYKKYAEDVKAAGYDPEKVLGDLKKALAKYDALVK
jgi:TRAP-type C4-dicarboxylate transport system substrate-binding protein